MLRQWVRSKVPSQEALRGNKALRLFGDRLLDPDYWFCNRHSAAVAVAAGLFAAWLPLPMHTLVAIALANRMARQLWAMMIKGEDFRDPASAGTA